MAAAIVLLAVLAGFWTHQSGLERWQKDALAFVPTLAAGQAQFDHVATDGRTLRQWLQARKTRRHRKAMPVGLETLPRPSAVRRSRPVGSRCRLYVFRMGGNELVHLVVTDASDLSHAPPNEPRFAREDGWTTASWTQKRASLHARNESLGTRTAPTAGDKPFKRRTVVPAVVSEI